MCSQVDSDFRHSGQDMSLTTTSSVMPNRDMVTDSMKKWSATLGVKEKTRQQYSIPTIKESQRVTIKGYKAVRYKRRQQTVKRHTTVARQPTPMY